MSARAPLLASLRGMIAAPFLLYLGHSADFIGIKTSRGLAAFRRHDCVGEFRHDDSPLTLDLPRMTIPQAAAAGAKTLVLGIANAGGRIDESMVADALAALDAGMHVAAGLHQRLRDVPALVARAAERGLSLIDVRDPPADLKVGTGYAREGNRILTVGTDCSVGKMYATIALAEGLRARGLDADFRATGQTGILIAGSGVPLDAVVADFISGAVEHLAPARHDCGWDVIEGRARCSILRSRGFPPGCCTVRRRRHWCCATTLRAATCAGFPVAHCPRWKRASPPILPPRG